MDKAEVTHVEKILHDARCRSLHQIRPAIDFAQTRIALCFKRWNHTIALFQPHPNQSISLLRFMHASAVAYGWRERGQRGHERALASRIELPAVIAAFQSVFHHAAQREFRPAMRATICPGLHLSRAVFPEHDVVAQELGGERLIAQISEQSDWVPERYFVHSEN